MKKENYYFASANTGIGFVNYLDQINDKCKKSFQFIIKGGAGSGKSSFIKNVAEYFFNLGYSIEYFYCSTDSQSLDGIRIVEKNVSLVDGTYPHIINEKIVGVDSRLIDLGQFLNLKINDNSIEIKKIIEEKSLVFNQLYRQLAVAEEYQKQNLDKITKDTNLQIIDDEVEKVMSMLPNFVLGNPTKRKLFFTSINNVNNNLEQKNHFDKTIKINLDEYQHFLFFEKLNKVLETKKIDYTLILNNINPNLIDEIIINQNNILIKNNKKTIKNNKINNILIKNIINFSKKLVNKSKNLHQQLEHYYIKCMDFCGVNKLRKKIIKEIKNYKC